MGDKSEGKEEDPDAKDEATPPLFKVASLSP